MHSLAIKKAIKQTRRAGILTALEEYDRTRKFSFQKEVVAFTIRRDLMEKFRQKHKKEMSSIIESLIKNYLKKEHKT